MTKLTVLMPTYNSEKYIKESIDSVLNQTYEDFIFLIINDGSKDRTEEIIKSYNDPRIIYELNSENLGIVKTLNKGIHMTKTKYLVRMDSDDILHLKKFEVQVSYMENNSEIDILGTQANYLTDDSRKSKRSYLPTTRNKINTHLLFTSAMIHPSIMFKMEKLVEHGIEYDEQFKGAEDYELWTRLALKNNLKNINKTLINYRLNPEGITETLTRKKQQRDELIKSVYRKHFKNLGIELNENDLTMYRKFINLSINITKESEIIQLQQILVKIKDNLSSDVFDIKYLDYMIGKYFRLNAMNYSLSYKKTIKIFSKHFSKHFKFNYLNRVLLYIRKFKENHLYDK